MQNGEQQIDATSGRGRWLPVGKVVALLRGLASSFSTSSSSSGTSTETVSALSADILSVQTRLPRVEASIRDAERREVRDGSVRVWLNELQELAYRAQDVLDLQQYFLAEEHARRRECSNPAASRRTKEIEEPDWAAAYDLHQVSFPFSSAPLGNDAASRREIGSAARSFRELFDEVYDMKEKLHLEEDEDETEYDYGGNGNTGFMPQLFTSSNPVDIKMFGRDKEMVDLVRLLLSGPKLGVGERSPSDNTQPVAVVALVGMGGVGKTTLAQHVFNNQAAKRHFTLKGWVPASHEFQVPDLIRKALEALGTDSARLSDLISLQDALRSRVNDRRFLLVLDDVWNERAELWQTFFSCFTQSAKGSRILITTRKLTVATVAGAAEPMKVGFLSDEDGWSLLQRHAFGNSASNRSCYHNYQLEAVGRKIVTKCKGLPLALKVLGCRLGFHLDEEIWTDVLESDLWDIQTYEEGAQILGPLLLSYLDLPSHLKHCFKICSMYPKDHAIDIYQLIALWMANDLIITNTNGNENWSFLVETGMRYIDSLMSRSFLHSKGQSEVGMHDLIHDLAQFLSGDGCAIIGKGEALDVHERIRHLLVWGGGSLRFGKRDFSLRTLIMGTRYSKCAVQITGAVHDTLGRLRMLTLCENPANELLECLDKLKYLRYLDCRFVTRGVLESIQSLYNLRVLELYEVNSENSGIRELPESIGNLKNLQRFLLMSTVSLNVKRLPDSIRELSSLCEFSLYRVKINEVPESIGCLTNLQKLNLHHSPIRTLPESIGKLTNLRELSLCHCNKMQTLPISIGRLSALQKLDLRTSGIISLPESTEELSNLQELCLSSCNRLQGLPSNMGGLSSLKKLDLMNCSAVKELPASIGQLSNLQELILHNCRSLAELPASTVNLSRLETLRLAPRISYLPAGFGRLKNLKFLSGSFPVGMCKEHAGIAELKNLVHLRFSVSISNLDNVVRLEDCVEANLMNKIYVEKLALRWGVPEDNLGTSKDFLNCDASTTDEEMLECLKPHTTVTELRISGWRGGKLPQWLGDQSFGSLVSIQLEACGTCHSLYPLPLLPSLKYVSLTGLPTLTEIIPKGNNQTHIDGDRDCHFPSIERFDMKNCSSVTSIPLYKLSSLRSIEISGGDSLESIDFLDPSLLEQPPSWSKPHSLMFLVIEGCTRLRRLSWYTHSPSIQNPPRVTTTPSARVICSNLVHLGASIEAQTCTPPQPTHYPKLFKISFIRCEQLRILSNAISSVQNLELVGCHSLSSIPLYSLNAIKVLSIYSCENLQSIDFDDAFMMGQPLVNMPTSLLTLYLHDCPRLHFAHATKLPITLEHIHIVNCPSLKSWSVFLQNSKEVRNVGVHIIDEQRSYFGSELLQDYPIEYYDDIF